ncbi:hypothetical protein AN189_09740 [Loktanella sp. 3ANDIMAR09]|uniref:hypothetical protein n=1 Tax=Loktanella sp. 3ANDIMAR09 TaxID=1225657 RepID=UPI0006FA0EC7|nr:hypothetical protein [Loktanella sp. 3ANDIMAR09]KQI68575.1 hypothetical protein AN189_09740 [Loktanella sp. 3ANDIMAR09]
MTDLPSSDEFFTKLQAAAYLGLSTRTLDRRNAERTGPPRVKHGNKIGYFKTSLIQWLKSHEVRP